MSNEIKKEVSDFDLNKEKTHSRLSINFTLLAISFTTFTFIVTRNPDLLQKNILLTLQLVCAIPLLMASTLSRSKLIAHWEKKRFDQFAYITFLFAYAFIINTIGIILFSVVSFFAGYVFFFINLIIPVIYSWIEVSYDRGVLGERISKDALFIFLLIVLGLLPALGILNFSPY